MSDKTDTIDPEQAWSAYDGKNWSRKLAAHLYRRAAFGADSATLDRAIEAGHEKTIAQIRDGTPEAPDFEKTMSALADRIVSSGNTEQLGAWWLYRIRDTGYPLLEKLTLFWHGHFASSAKKVEKPRMMLDQNDLLRKLGQGRLEKLVRAISRDPAMLIYLDSTSNRRIHPNENYARELMELFCLGVGNYTEKDVKEVARAFTGWEVLGEQFHFDQAQHDTHDKAFLGQTGNFGGDDAIRVILDQPAASRFIARKLIRFFVVDEPTPPAEIIEPIAAGLRESNFDIGQTVRRILSSNFFFSASAVGRKVRSPVDIGMNLLVCLGATTNLVSLNQAMTDLGQGLFFPPNVKGWPGGRDWINSSTLLGRANLVTHVLGASETSFERAGGSLASAADRAGAKTPEQTVDWLLELLTAAPIPPESREALLSLAGGKDAPDDRGTRIANVIRAMGALPEFQLA